MGRATAVAVTSDKMSSGVSGFDEITGGGLPRGRVTAVLGSAGSGKTIFALQALVAGVRAGEPGLFVAFEENPDWVVNDARRFDWNLAALRGKGLEFFDAQLSQTILLGGEFDLIGLLAIIAVKAKQVGARRLVFDGLDVLLGYLGDVSLRRREIFRLREWLYAHGMTGIVTAKAGARDGELSADYEFLQYMSDCVVSLHHRVSGGAAIRSLRVAKYRGDSHSASEFPFTITSAGIDLAEGTSAVLDHAVSTERISSGVALLDAMLCGGYYRGTSVLISGAPGTCKSSLAAAFAEAACVRKERTVYMSFDEAPAQIIRNVASIGIDLAPHFASGVLTMCSLRARSDNPEAHVARIRELVKSRQARNLVIDPISALLQTTDEAIADHAAVQILDVAKSRGVTTVSTSLLANSAPLSEETPIRVSTIADTWMHLSYVSKAGERNRALTIVKSRGTSHSNQVRELVLSDDGITLAAPYMSGGEVLMGTLRWEREVEDRRARQAELSESELRQRRAELAVTETRIRVEAARTEQAMREAELGRIVATRLAANEAEDAVAVERSTRRGGSRAPEAVAPGAKRRGKAHR